MIRGIIFDFDGVLANSEPLHFRAFKTVLEEEGLSLSEPDYYDKYLGYDDVGAFTAIAADSGCPLAPDRVEILVARKAERLEALERDGSVLFPGAHNAIVRMAVFGPIAIASGALRVEIERVLAREGLTEFFPVIVSAEDTPASKPDPAPYRTAVERLAMSSGIALAPAECVAVEDSKWGLQSARTAGLRTVGITHSYPAEALEGAELVIDHLDRLTADLFTTFEA